MGREGPFKTKLIKDLETIFPGCLVLKNDASYIQGIPDLLVLFEDRWAALETKRHCSAARQPNQEYYVEIMNRMSFARFVCPENKEDVLYDLQQTFTS